MRLILLALILLTACSSELDVVSGPFLIKDGLTYHQATNKPVTGVTQDFYENGQLETKISYRNGLKHGSYEKFHDNGQLYERAFHHKGTFKGSYEKFSSDGDLIVTSRYVNGLKHGVEKTFSSGIISSRSNWIMGQQTGLFEVFHDNGKVRSNAMVIDGGVDGLEQIFFDTGLLKRSVVWVRGQLRGPLKIYNKHGKLMIEGQYKDSEKHGLFNSYSSDGKEHASWQCDLGKYIKGTYKLSVGKINEVVPFVENSPFNGAVVNPFDQENPSGIEIDGKTYYLCSIYNLEGSI